jgi:hypothetical protein
MKYFTILIFTLITISCKNETESIVIWENDKYKCTVKKEIFNKRIDNYLLAKNEEGNLVKTLNKKIKETTINVWLLAEDKETKLLLENWRNRFYWDDNLTFVDKVTNQIITTVTEEEIHDFSGSLDVVIIGTDTLFQVRSIII